MTPLQIATKAMDGSEGAAEMNKITVTWREWFNDHAVEQMSKMGTLPEYETEIDGWVDDDGEHAAMEIAKTVNAKDFEQFRESCEIEILKPENLAGSYSISVDYEPTFYAEKK